MEKQKMILKTTSRALGIMLTLLAAINSSAQTPDSRTLAANYQRDAQKLMEQYFEPLPSGVTSACDDHVPLGRCKAHKKQCARQCNCVSNYNAAASALEARFKEQSRAVNTQSTAGNRQGGTVEYSPTRQTVTSPPVVLNQGQFYAAQLNQEMSRDIERRQQQAQQQISTLEAGAQGLVNQIMETQRQKSAEAVDRMEKQREKASALKDDAAAAAREFQQEGTVDALDRLGRAAWEMQDYSQAFEINSQAARAGSINALMRLSWAYELGKGVAKNDSMAYAMATKCALSSGSKSFVSQLLRMHARELKEFKTHQWEFVHWLYFGIALANFDVSEFRFKEFIHGENLSALADIYSNRGTETDLQHALSWLNFGINNKLRYEAYDFDEKIKKVNKLIESLKSGKRNIALNDTTDLFEQAVLLELNGQHDASVLAFKASANVGVTEAMLVLGMQSAHAGNFDESLIWYKKLNAVMPNCYLTEIDILYANKAGQALENKDETAALRWFKEGAEYLVERPIEVFRGYEETTGLHTFGKLHYSVCMRCLGDMYEGINPSSYNKLSISKDLAAAGRWKQVNWDRWQLQQWVEGRRKPYQGK